MITHILTVLIWITHLSITSYNKLFVKTSINYQQAALKT